MPSSYRACLAVTMAIMVGLFGLVAAIGTVHAEGSQVMITSVKVQPTTPQSSRLVLQGTARFEYTVLKPETKLVTIDLFGADTSQLQPTYSVNGTLVDTVRLKSVGAPGKVAARLEISLAQPCETKSQFVAETNSLVVDFTAGKVAQAEPSDSRVAKAAGRAAVEGIATEQDDNGFVASIQTTGATKFKHSILHNPERIVVDFLDAENAVPQRVVNVDSKFVKRIRVGTPDVAATRIVFDLKANTPYDVVEGDKSIAVRIGEVAGLTASKPATKEAKPEAVPTRPKQVEKALPPAATAAKSSEPPPKPMVSKESSEVPDTPVTVAELKPASFSRVESAEPAATSSTTKRRKNQNGNLQFGDPGFQGDPISLDITGVDLSDILRFISDNYDVNFVLDKSVQRVDVTIKVNNVPWSQVVESIFRANRLAYKREGMVVRVATLAAFAEEETQRKAQNESVIDNLPIVTEYFKFKYEQVGAGGAAGGIRQILQNTLSKRGTLALNPRTNTVIVTDIPERIDRVREVIARLDVAEPQVEIEARIVQANRSFLRDLGVQLFTGVVSQRGGGIGFSTAGGQSRGFRFGPNDNLTAGSGIIRGQFRPRDFVADSLFIGPTASGLIGGRGTDSVLSLTTGLIGTGFISAAITAAESKGILKTVSSPRVTVMNNSEGEIRSGRSIPFTAAQAIGAAAVPTTIFVEATLSLKITPQITSEGNVLLRLESTNDSVDLSFNVNGQPPINRQSSKTIVLVPDGGTTIIGGINVDTEQMNQVRTPGISSLPLIGNLFKNKFVQRSTQEILFFITPRIYRGENFVTNGEPTQTPAPANPSPAPAGGNPGGQP